MNSTFRDKLGETIFKQKYAIHPQETWQELAVRVVDDVVGNRQGTKPSLLSKMEQDLLVDAIAKMKFIPGGRYLYYAGRPYKAYNNCYLLRAEEDTREEWSNLMFRASSCLMTGGGIGIDYSRLRRSNVRLSRTGGISSGPLPLMDSINSIGNNVMQGGARRSAIYASLNWRHGDINEFITIKDWNNQYVKGAFDSNGSSFTVGNAKINNFHYRAPMDSTNISVNYDDAWLDSENRWENDVFLRNVEAALSTGEPGFSFNFREKQNETLRNACTEVTSEDDSDVCNLGSINLGNIESLEEFRLIVALASKFLVCGTLRADLPYEKVYTVREKNRRLGLGLMGIHEWLIKRGLRYEVSPELHSWLQVYKSDSEYHANTLCDALSISRPVAYRAIAPTGSIGILAGTTTGIEPLFAVAYKRRYLDGRNWKYQNIIDSTTAALIKANPDYKLGNKWDDIIQDTAHGLSSTMGGRERRIKMQADIQDYVDQSISSTLNISSWGSDENNRDDIQRFAKLLSDYAPRLRGFTCYPDGSRGGQPIEPISLEEAVKTKGVVYEENDSCKGGVCGL